MKFPRDWNKGDKFEAAHLNEVVAVARSVAKITGTGDITVAQGPGGTVIQDGREAAFEEIFIGEIVAQGPGGASDPDYTDERYWVKRLVPVDAASVRDRLTLADQAAGEFVGDHIVTAANVEERATGTHLLTAGDRVLVFRLDENNANGLLPRYVFQAQATEPSCDAGGATTTLGPADVTTTTARATGVSFPAPGQVVIRRYRYAFDAAAGLYGFWWDETYDSCGKLLEVGAESYALMFGTTTSCPTP